MKRLGLMMCSLLLGLALACGDDDGSAGSGAAGAGGSSGSGGSGGSGGGTGDEGSICNTGDDCDSGLACVPRGVTTADPLFCARGCERHDQCGDDERCVAYCDPSEPGCTDSPGHCSKVVTTPWGACGFSITSTCGDTPAPDSDPLTCITTTSSGGSLGFCAQLCEFNTAGQCPTGEICSAEILASNTTGVCATPKARGEACEPLSGDVCDSADICASLVDTSGAGTCRQFCGTGLPACEGATECTVFAQFGTQTLSACFPTADGQDAGI